MYTLKQGIILRIFLLSSVGSNYFQIFFLSIYLSGKEASLITLELLYFLCYYHLSISYIYIFIYPSYIYIFIYLSYIYIFIYLSYIFIFIYLSIHFLLCHLFNQVCLLSMLWQPRIPSRSANPHKKTVENLKKKQLKDEKSIERLNNR